MAQEKLRVGMSRVSAHEEGNTSRQAPHRDSSSERLMNSDSLTNFDFENDDDLDIENLINGIKNESWKKKPFTKSDLEMTPSNNNLNSKKNNNDDDDKNHRSNFLGKDGDSEPLQSSGSYDFEALAEKHHRALLQGLVYGRAVWFGGISKVDILYDCWFYTCQYHPLLCIFLAHPAHPFGRFERGLHLIAMLFFAFFIASISELRHSGESLFSTAKILWVLLSNFLLFSLDIFMREIVTCSCIHPGGWFESCSIKCGCVESCLELGIHTSKDFLIFFLVVLFFVCLTYHLTTLGRCALRVCLFGTFALFFIGIMLVATKMPGRLGNILYLWAVMKCLMWVLYLPLAFLMYSYGRSTERESWEDGERSLKYPYGPSIPSIPYLNASMAHPCCADETQTASSILDNLKQNLDYLQLVDALQIVDGNDGDEESPPPLSRGSPSSNSLNKSKSNPSSKSTNSSKTSSKWRMRKESDTNNAASGFQRPEIPSPSRSTARERLAERLKKQSVDI